MQNYNLDRTWKYVRPSQGIEVALTVRQLQCTDDQSISVIVSRAIPLRLSASSTRPRRYPKAECT